jgi:hypothetical protein
LAFVVPHAADDSVGEVSVVCSAGFASGLAFCEFPVHVGLGVVDVALLRDAGDVENAVHSSVAAKIEAVSDGLVRSFA